MFIVMALNKLIIRITEPRPVVSDFRFLEAHKVTDARNYTNKRDHKICTEIT